MNDDSTLDSVLDYYTTDELTTSEEYLQKIEYNTHMASVSLQYIYVLAILVITFTALILLFKHWYFDGI